MIVELAKEAEISLLKMLLEEKEIPHLFRERGDRTLAIFDQMDTSLLMHLKERNLVQTVIECPGPHKLVSKAYKETTRIPLHDVEIGGNQVVMLSGPCAIESVEQLVEAGRALKKQGVVVLRASAYKPRTSPYTFQGHGIAGLKMHFEAQRHHGLLTETEVMDPRDVDVVARYVDILRVGARNMQNYDLLKELGRCGKPVILKRGLHATIDEWLSAAEYVMAYGNDQVILCERGIRTFETKTRGTLDISSIPVLKELTHLPVIVDPSHAAGRKELVAPLAQAAVAVGADGLLIECHPKPCESLCDARQALSLEEHAELTRVLERIAHAIGRTL